MKLNNIELIIKSTMIISIILTIGFLLSISIHSGLGYLP